MQTLTRRKSPARLAAFAGVALAAGAFLYGNATAQTQDPQPVQPQANPPAIAEAAGPDGVVFFSGAFRGSMFNFQIDDKTPVKDLLPAPPNVAGEPAPFLGNDLAQVPEIAFEQPNTPKKTGFRPGDPLSSEGLKQVAHQVAKVNYLNQKDAD